MRRTIDSACEAMGREDLNELSSTCIVGTFNMYVEVACNKDWSRLRRNKFKELAQVFKENEWPVDKNKPSWSLYDWDFNDDILA